MKVSDYRNLIDAVADGIASVRGTRDPHEQASECNRLCDRITELQAATCATTNPYDRERAARVLRVGCQLTYMKLMALYDNDCGPLVDHWGSF